VYTFIVKYTRLFFNFIKNMLSIRRFFLFCGVFLCSFFIFSTVLAQEVFSDTTVSEDILINDDVDVDEETGEALDISLENIGSSVIEEVPSSFGLFFRGIRERISLMTTFNPVKKAEKRLQYALERENIAERILEESLDFAAQKKAQDMIDRSQAFIEKVHEQQEKWMNGQDDRAQQLLKNVANFELRREKLFDRLEEKLSDEQLIKFQEKRDVIEQKSQRLLNALDNENIPEEIRLHLQKVKERVEEHYDQQQEYKAGLLKAIQSGDATAVKELREQRHDENVIRFDEKKVQIQERKDVLRERAEDGDIQAQKEIRLLHSVVENGQKRVEEVKERVEERREDLKELIEYKREEIKEQKETVREEVKGRVEERREFIDEQGARVEIRREERLDSDGQIRIEERVREEDVNSDDDSDDDSDLD